MAIGQFFGGDLKIARTVRAPRFDLPRKQPENSAHHARKEFQVVW
jgi:hypothetical protein